MAQLDRPIETPDISGVTIHWLTTPVDEEVLSTTHNGNSHIQPQLFNTIISLENEIHVAYTTFGRLEIFSDYDGIFYVVYDAARGKILRSMSSPYQESGRQKILYGLGINEEDNLINMSCMRNLEPIDSSGSSFFGAAYQFSTVEVSSNDLVEYHGDAEDTTALSFRWPPLFNTPERYFPVGRTFGNQMTIEHYMVDLDREYPKPCLSYIDIDRLTGRVTSRRDTLCMSQSHGGNILNGGLIKGYWDAEQPTRAFFFSAYDIENPDIKHIEMGLLDREYNLIGDRMDISEYFIDPDNFNYRVNTDGDFIMIFKNQIQDAREGHIITWLDKEGNALRESDLISRSSGSEYNTSAAGYSLFKAYDNDVEEMRYFAAFLSDDRNKLDILEILEDGSIQLLRQISLELPGSDIVISGIGNMAAKSVDSVYWNFRFSDRLDGIGWSHFMCFSLRDTTSSATENTLSEWAQVYPNPCSDFIHLEAKSQWVDSEIEIMNSLGQIMDRHTIVAGENKWSVSSYPDGLYFYQINKAKGSTQSLSTGTLMKQKK